MKNAILLVGLFGAQVLFAASVSDPVKNFLVAEDLGLNDRIYQVRVDLNNDGILDYMLSNSSEYRDGQKAGMKWDFYISDGEGFHQVVSKSGEAVYFRQDAFSIEKSPESGRVGVRAFFPADADHGTFTTYSIENDQITRESTYVRTKNPDGSPNQVLFNAGIENRIEVEVETESASAAAKRFGLEISSRSTEIDDTYYVIDQKNPQRQLVYSSTTDELLGYREFGVFHPISESEPDEIPIPGKKPKEVDSSDMGTGRVPLKFD